MEQTGQAGPNRPSQSRHQSTSTETKIPFSTLNPALFIPLQTFPPLGTPSTIPQTQEEHLQKLISNLLAQHETVKQNLIIVATLRAKEIRKLAQAEIDSLPPSSISISNEIAQKDESVRKGIEETMRKMRAHPMHGARSEDFELKPTLPKLMQSVSATATSIPSPAKPFTFREGGRVVQLATPIAPPERTAQIVRAETAKKIRELIDNSVVEIEKYEKDAEAHIDVYRSLLEKTRLQMRNPGFATVMGERKKSLSATASPVERPLPPKGILTNFTPTPVDLRALRRMSKEEATVGTGDGVKQKSKEELRKEEEARALAQMEAKATEARERMERAEIDAQLQEMLAMQDEILRNVSPEEAARLMDAARR